MRGGEYLDNYANIRLVSTSDTWNVINSLGNSIISASNSSGLVQILGGIRIMNDVQSITPFFQTYQGEYLDQNLNIHLPSSSGD